MTLQTQREIDNLSVDELWARFNEFNSEIPNMKASDIIDKFPEILYIQFKIAQLGKGGKLVEG